MALFILKFLLLVTLCNSRKIAEMRILKGSTARLGEFPYQVSLQVNGAKNICGGAILSDRHIVTAAHCFANETGYVYNAPIKVVAGVSDLRSVPLSRQTVDIERVYIPHDFFHYDKSKHPIGDIAVAKLLDPLYLGDGWYLRKVNLPEDNRTTYDGESALVSGFGWNWIKLKVDPLTRVPSEVGDTDNLLHYARADVVNRTACQKVYTKTISDQHLCAQIARDDQIDGVCNGDSGGPLVWGGDTLIGVIRSSPPRCNERLKPALYTRVSSYLNFIDKAMKNVSDPEIFAYNLRIARVFLKLHV